MTIGIAGLPELTHNYIEAIQLAAVPYALPDVRNRWEKPDGKIRIEVSLLPECAARWDALVLPGGGDIDPLLLPGRPAPDPHCRNTDPALDRRQLAILELFVRKKKPVLGICKGMQLINLRFGGGLCQHLPTAEAHRYKDCDQLHSTHAKTGSFLAALYGSDFTVNSAHHQGILVPKRTRTARLTDKCSSGQNAFFAADSHAFPLTVMQTAADGVPEGIVHKELPVIGLQWHPERLCGRYARQDAADGGLVFQYFLSLAANKSGVGTRFPVIRGRAASAAPHMPGKTPPSGRCVLF